MFLYLIYYKQPANYPYEYIVSMFSLSSYVWLFILAGRLRDYYSDLLVNLTHPALKVIV